MYPGTNNKPAPVVSPPSAKLRTRPITASPRGVLFSPVSHRGVVASLDAVITLVEAATQLCEADQGTIARERDGVFQRAATYGFSNEFTEYVRRMLARSGSSHESAKAPAGTCQHCQSTLMEGLQKTWSHRI
jgi:hypothetical protein